LQRLFFRKEMTGDAKMHPSPFVSFPPIIFAGNIMLSFLPDGPHSLPHVKVVDLGLAEVIYAI
jgi:hypothetical protein